MTPERARELLCIELHAHAAAGHAYLAAFRDGEADGGAHEKAALAAILRACQEEREACAKACEVAAGGDDFLCESCGKQIKAGDKYTVTMDGCYLCEEDAPSFQDCIDYWAHHKPDGDDELASATDCQKALADHVSGGGKPDDKPLWIME